MSTLTLHLSFYYYFSDLANCVTPSRSSGNTLSAYKAAATNTGTSVSPPTVQGGVLSQSANPGSSSSSSSAAPAASPSVNAASDGLNGDRNWLAVIVSVLAAVTV